VLLLLVVVPFISHIRVSPLLFLTKRSLLPSPS
jgi:hypothetical protein